MEFLMISACLVMMGMCFSVTLLAVILLLRKPHETPREEELEEPQEQEAAEARQRYEQGFFNLMQYDGRPGREKERENR